jgi:hypothetical protein
MEYPEISRSQPNAEMPRYIVGAIQNPDGSWDCSKAMVRLSSAESKEAIERARQRDAVISGKIKHQIEANPSTFIDVEQARTYWGRMYDEAEQGARLEMQLNEIYAQKYEEYAKSARERMVLLERKLGKAKSEREIQTILVKIVEERDFIIEMEKEARCRRGY